MACELIDAGSDFSISEIDAKGVLLNAVRNGKTEVVRKLIHAGIAVDEVNGEGKNALFEAVSCSNEIIVHLLVEEGKAFVNARDLNGRTPLFYAITKSTNLSIYLIEKGANVKLKDFRNRSVFSFFIEDCMMNEENISLSSLISDKSEEFNMLIKEPNKQFKHYIKTMLGIVLCKLPLMCAFEENTVLPSYMKKIWNNFSPALTVARTYFEEQKNTKKMNSIDSILKIFEDKEAFSRNCSELIELLVDLGGNANFADSDGNTALHYVTHLPFLGVSNEVTMSVLTLLARHGLSLNAKNNQNQTPLLFCLTGSLEKLEEKDKSPAMKTLVQVCTFLVNNGSNTEEMTKSGESVFHLIIKLFQKGLQIGDETARKNVIDEALKIWELFSSERMIKGNTVNKRDFHLNSPLHYWASLDVSPNYSSSELFRDTLEKILQHLINLGTILNARNEYEQTPLHLCKSWTAVQLLLNVGANPNDVDSSGSPPLLVAALYLDVSEDAKEFQESAIKKGAVKQSNNESVFRALIDAGADVNRTDNEGKTPVFNSNKNPSMNMPTHTLFLGDVEVLYNEAEARAALFDAARNDTPWIIEQLHRSGLDLNVNDNDCKTAVFYANENNSMDVLCELIKYGAEFQLDEIDGKAVLFYAAKNDFLGVVESLHDAGLDLDITDDDDGKTALALAVENNSMDIICDLIRGDAHFVSDDIDGKAVLFYAAKYNEEGVVKPLRYVGLDLNETDDKGKTAVFYANMNYSKDVLCELIEWGADFDLDEIDGRAALLCAVEHGMDVAVWKLLSAGLDVNTTDNQGKTALFYAVQQSENKNVVRALIDAGADVYTTDNEGKTALFYAVDRDAVDALIEEDEESLINARDQYGRTALFYALEQYSMTTARYLIDKGGNLYLKDKCSVSIFAFFIEKSRYRALTSNVSELFQEQHQLNYLAAAVLDVIYCQAPLLSAKSFLLQKGYKYQYRILDETYLLEALTFARTQGFTHDDDKRKAIDEIAFLITKDKVDVPSLLAWLNTLGVNPDAADSDGNTALHYATLLPLYGVSQVTAIDICKKLKDLGAMFDVKNQQQQSPLLLCMSADNWEVVETNNPRHVVRGLVGVCRFLLNNGSSVNETSQSGESAFHLLTKFVQNLFNLQGSKQPDVLQELIDLWQLVASKALERGKEKIANKSDSHLNSPLHLWASLTLPSPADYSSRLTEDHTFENILQLIFDILLEFGAKLNPRNENEDTPLHLCKTWAAVKLLIDAGANTNELNSSKRSPLLVAAKEKTYLKKPGCFYPDVADDPQTFWKGALEGRLDPWTADKQSESVLSILIESEAFVLAKALIDVGIELNNIQSETKLALLCIICKDKSTHTHWKTNLVEMILKSAIKSRLPVDSALRLCCRNIVQYGVLENEVAKNQKYVQGETKDEPNDDDGQPPNKKRRKEEAKEESNDDLVTFDSVHWKLAKQLLLYGVDIRIRGSSGESCLDIAENCPALKDLLTKPIDVDSVPLLIPWTSVSKKYEDKLAKVARRQECQIVEQIWYHKDDIGSGSFGLIFAGINEKDGREVAIKRVEKLRMQRTEDKREMQNLTALADCQQVVRYLSFFEDQDFCYVVLELMEGNLEKYLNESTIDATEATLLCKDVVMGLKFLHEQNILHRDLKPQNILFKTHPKLCLKIADFGLSRRIDSTSTTVYGTNAGTKCWIAPEILNSPPKDHSKSSDMFSCGLLLHYILSGQKHPFCPADVANKSKIQVAHEAEDNLMKGKMEGWNNSLSPEASHLVKKMIENTVKNRPTAEEAIDHPLFWTKEKKIDLLIAVGNQPEFECPRAKRMRPLTAVETDLESSLGAIVKYRSWTDPRYLHIPNVYTETMTSSTKKAKVRSYYNTASAVELVRFIRNAYAHVSEDTRPSHIRKLLLEDFVFLEYFPALVMEVYKAVTTHGWDQTREEIKYAMNK